MFAPMVTDKLDRVVTSEIEWLIALFINNSLDQFPKDWTLIIFVVTESAAILSTLNR